jgi:hypothetical protein
LLDAGYDALTPNPLLVLFLPWVLGVAGILLLSLVQTFLDSLNPYTILLFIYSRTGSYLAKPISKVSSIKTDGGGEDGELLSFYEYIL